MLAIRKDFRLKRQKRASGIHEIDAGQPVGERDFLRANKDKPFFLYYPTTVPHLAYQVPEDSLAEYLGKFEEPSPATGNYAWHRAPRAARGARQTV